MVITFTQEETAAIVEAHVRAQLVDATQGKTVKVEFNGRYGYLSECTVEICEPDSKAEAKAAA